MINFFSVHQNLNCYNNSSSFLNYIKHKKKRKICIAKKKIKNEGGEGVTFVEEKYEPGGSEHYSEQQAY